MKNNENLANEINSIDYAISGSGPFTTAQQSSLISSLGQVHPLHSMYLASSSLLLQYSDKLATLFENTGEKASDFQVPSDQDQIQGSADALERTNDVSQSHGALRNHI